MFRKCDVHAGTKHRCRREGHLVGHAVMQGFSVPIYMCNQHAAEYEKYGKIRILNKFTSLFDERDWLEPWAQDGRPIESIDSPSSEEPKSPLSPDVEGDTIVFGTKALADVSAVDELSAEQAEERLASLDAAEAEISAIWGAAEEEEPEDKE